MITWGALFISLALGVTCQESTTPASNAPGAANTRFLPGLDNLVGGALSFLDPCSRCSFSNQQFASQCCQRGNRQCCRFLQPVGPPIGTFPGAQVGAIGGGFGPPGLGNPGFGGNNFGGNGFGGNNFGGNGFGGNGFGGAKPGICPQLGSTSFGSGRFGGSQCVAECQSDFQCAGIQKCCQVGCSSICRSPQGAAQNVIVGNQQIVKPGFCPRTGISALLLGRSGAADTTTAGQPGVETFLEGDNVGMSGRQIRKEQRRQQRKEEKQEGRTKRQVDNRDDFRNDRRNRRLNRLNRVRGRVIRQVENRDDFRNERRNRRLNRLGRIRGRVTRQAPSQSTPSNGDANTRFFPLPGIPGIKNPFCNNECFNDSDCLGRLKCCVDEGECKRCLDPVAF